MNNRSPILFAPLVLGLLLCANPATFAKTLDGRPDAAPRALGGGVSHLRLNDVDCDASDPASELRCLLASHVDAWPGLAALGDRDLDLRIESRTDTTLPELTLERITFERRGVRFAGVEMRIIRRAGRPIAVYGKLPDLTLPPLPSLLPAEVAGPYAYSPSHGAFIVEELSPDGLELLVRDVTSGEVLASRPLVAKAQRATQLDVCDYSSSFYKTCNPASPIVPHWVQMDVAVTDPVPHCDYSFYRLDTSHGYPAATRFKLGATSPCNLLNDPQLTQYQSICSSPYDASIPASDFERFLAANAYYWTVLSADYFHDPSSGFSQLFNTEPLTLYVTDCPDVDAEYQPGNRAIVLNLAAADDFFAMAEEFAHYAHYQIVRHWQTGFPNPGTRALVEGLAEYLKFSQAFWEHTYNGRFPNLSYEWAHAGPHAFNYWQGVKKGEYVIDNPAYPDYLIYPLACGEVGPNGLPLTESAGATGYWDPYTCGRVAAGIGWTLLWDTCRVSFEPGLPDPGCRAGETIFQGAVFDPMYITNAVFEHAAQATLPGGMSYELYLHASLYFDQLEASAVISAEDNARVQSIFASHCVGQYDRCHDPAYHKLPDSAYASRDTVKTPTFVEAEAAAWANTGGVPFSPQTGFASNGEFVRIDVADDWYVRFDLQITDPGPRNLWLVARDGQGTTGTVGFDVVITGPASLDDSESFTVSDQWQWRQSGFSFDFYDPGTYSVELHFTSAPSPELDIDAFLFE